jgi:ribosome maturation factor RimP
VLKKLVEFLDREVEIWTEENTEPWEGILREVQPEYVILHIDQLETYICAEKIVAFRLSEGEQTGGEEEGEEEGEEGEEEER